LPTIRASKVQDVAIPIEDEFNYIATKLGITPNELRGYFTMPKKFYWDYKNSETIFNLGAKFLKFIGVEKSIKR
jgi:hypothetical protein